MTIFKVGDRVEPVYKYGPNKNLTGTVSEVFIPGVPVPQETRLNLPKAWGYQTYSWTVYRIDWDQDEGSNYRIFAGCNLRPLKEKNVMKLSTVTLKPVPRGEVAPIRDGGFKYAVLNVSGLVMALFVQRCDADTYADTFGGGATVRELGEDE